MSQVETEKSTLSNRAFPLITFGLFAFGSLTLGLGISTYTHPEETLTEPYTHFQLHEFKVPLTTNSGNTVLKMTIELEIKASRIALIEEAGVMTALRSGIITYSEAFKPDQLDEEDEVAVFKQGLFNRINGILAPDSVEQLVLKNLSL